MAGGVKMKCGDLVCNHWASDKNPTKYFVFIGDNGKRAECIYYNGQRLCKSSYYSNDLKDTEKFEIVGHIDILQFIKDPLMKLNENNKRR